MSPITQERLKWLEEARQGLLMAIGEDVMDPTINVFTTSDPLRFILKITLHYPLAKASRQALRIYLRACAEANNCDIPTVNIDDKRLRVQAEVLTKVRHWRTDEELYKARRELADEVEGKEEVRRPERSDSRDRRSRKGLPRRAHALGNYRVPRSAPEPARGGDRLEEDDGGGS